MNKLLISLALITMGIILPGKVYSQNSFSIHAGPSFPLSDFGDDDRTDYDSGLAGVGFVWALHTYIRLTTKD